MSGMYAMQRANGDWFAFDDHGRLRVPVFHSSRDAMQARMRNAGMLLFKPVALAKRTILDMASGDNNSAMYFWLVDNLSGNVKRGHLIEHTQLSQLVRDAGEQTLVGSEV
jgi:hypothetical protein